MGVRTLIIAGLFSVTSISPAPQTNYIIKEKVIYSEKPFNLEEEINRLPFKYKDIVIAQYKLESGYCTSKIFKENNNAFGVRLAKQRSTFAISSKNGYAVYRNVRESLLDRLYYEARYMDKMNREAYLKFLGETYSGAGNNYITELNKIIKNGR